jgi:putative aldouronate transport system permease protein
MNATAPAVKAKKAPKNALKKDNIFKRFWKTRFLFALFVPALVYFIMFKYVPMWGVTLSFYKYNIFKGWAGSTFVGLRNFEVFFNSPSFWSITSNTLVLGIQSLLITFPVTILFSLLLNEIRSLKFKKITQTISYMPHFLSVVVVCSLATSLLDPTQGAINSIIKAFGGKPIYFLMESQWFRPIYLITEVWQGLGWGTIVYLAAISSVDPGLYEAARLDGAGRWRQMWSITLPAIAPTVATMFILKIGHIMDASMEKVLLLQQPITYDVSQVLSTYVYQIGLQQSDYALSTAAGLFSSLINLIMLIGADWVSKKVTDTGVF